MGDVVTKGRDEGSSRRPPWLRGAGLVTLAALLAYLVVRSGALSGERSAPAEQSGRPTALSAGPGPALATSVLGQRGRELVRYGSGQDRVIGRLPAGFAAGRPVVVTRTRDRGGEAVAVDDGTLYRLDPGRARAVTRLGPAIEVVDAAVTAGRVLVLAPEVGRPRLVVLDVGTGIVVDRDPFPGFDAATGWQPRATLVTYGRTGLLMSRPLRDDREELAVAWSRRDVEAGRAPELRPIGSPGRLLATTDEWLVVTRGSCPGPGCRLAIVTVSADRTLTREVAAPTGWFFAPGEPAGPSHVPLVPVVSVSDGSTALARLVAGGESTLLLRGSGGVIVDAGLHSGPNDDVYFALPEGADRQRVAGWRPADPSRVERLPGVPPLPRSARLLCVCG